jgi:hypothetical protein
MFIPGSPDQRISEAEVRPLPASAVATLLAWPALSTHLPCHRATQRPSVEYCNIFQPDLQQPRRNVRHLRMKLGSRREPEFYPCHPRCPPRTGQRCAARDGARRAAAGKRYDPSHPTLCVGSRESRSYGRTRAPAVPAVRVAARAVEPAPGPLFIAGSAPGAKRRPIAGCWQFIP